jgi:hypothetical protein
METAWKHNLATVPVVARSASLLQAAPHRFVLARRHLNITRVITVRLTIKANRGRRELISYHHHKLQIRLWISFTPTGGRQRDTGYFGLRISP